MEGLHLKRGFAVAILVCLLRTLPSLSKQSKEEEEKHSSRVTTILVETNAAFNKLDQDASFSKPTLYFPQFETETSQYTTAGEGHHGTTTQIIDQFIPQNPESTTTQSLLTTNFESSSTESETRKSTETAVALENEFVVENETTEAQTDDIPEQITTVIVDPTIDFENISTTIKSVTSSDPPPPHEVLTTQIFRTMITFPTSTSTQKATLQETNLQSTTEKITTKDLPTSRIESSSTLEFSSSPFPTVSYPETSPKMVIVTEREPLQREISSTPTLSQSFESLAARGTSKILKPTDRASQSDKKPKNRNRKEKKDRKNKRRDKEKKKTTQAPDLDLNSGGSSATRLQSSVIPVHYVLRLRPELAGDYLVQGVVEIEIETREPTHRLRLHSANLDIKKASIEVTLLKAHKKVPIKSVRMSSKRQTLALKLGRRLKPGRAYILQMEFSYRLKREAKGFYRRSYLDRNGDKRWIATTQFWPSKARRAFPCFDEAEIKSTFDIHLAHTKDYKAISNMPIVRSYRIEQYPELVWDHFATTPKMPTHLLAFAITDFSFVRSKEDSEVLLRVWARDEALNRTQQALHFATSSLDFFGKYFGRKYPLPKLDVIALPTSAHRTVNNWGLLTFRESSLVLPEDADHWSLMQMATLVVRQIAQQWFGSLVTFNLDDLWLIEGFSTYMSYVAVNEIEPSWNGLENFVVDHMQAAMFFDSSFSSESVSGHVRNPHKARGGELGDSSFNKGASIMRMMQHFLTQKTFIKGLQQYVKEFSFKNAKQGELWSILNQVAVEDGSLPVGVTLKTIVDTWTKQPGYPVINLIRSDNTSAILSQQRFLSESNHTSDDLTWWVPITFTGEDRPTFRHTRAQTWLRQGVPTLKVTGLPPIDRWVIFNLQATGFYRVNYDDLTWTLLIEQLKRDSSVIHVNNRAQLVDDAMQLASSGDLPYNLALEVLTYLRLENNFMPWLSGLRNLQYINSMLRRTKDYGAFKKFVFSLMDPLIGSIGMEEVAGDPVQKNLLRAALKERACQMGHPICIQKTLQFFKDWTNRTSSLRYESSVDFLTFCVGIREGDEKLWNFLWDISQRTKDPTNRISLLKALACTRQVWILSRYLQAIGNSALSFLREDASEIYRAAKETAVGDYVTWDAFLTSWNNFKNFSVTPKIIEVVTSGFNTHYQKKELDSFYSEVLKENADASSSETPIVQALENAVAKTQSNIKWLESSYDTIIRWLSDNGFTSNLINLQVNLAT